MPSSSKYGNLKRKYVTESSSGFEMPGKDTLEIIKKYLLRFARRIATSHYFERFVEFLVLIIVLAVVWFAY